MSQQVLAEPQWTEPRLTDAYRRPLFPPWTQVNPYERFELAARRLWALRVGGDR